MVLPIGSNQHRVQVIAGHHALVVFRVAPVAFRPLLSGLLHQRLCALQVRLSDVADSGNLHAHRQQRLQVAGAAAAYADHAHAQGLGFLGCAKGEGVGHRPRSQGAGGADFQKVSTVHFVIHEGPPTL